MTPKLLLRLEGGAVFAAAVLAYVAMGGPWWLFLLLILAPDLAMLGYLGGPRSGSISYNLLHSYVLPLALLVAGYLGGLEAARYVALIWLAHIGVDRLLGYGLKYPEGFKETHLNRV